MSKNSDRIESALNGGGGSTIYKYSSAGEENNETLI